MVKNKQEVFDLRQSDVNVSFWLTILQVCLIHDSGPNRWLYD